MHRSPTLFHSRRSYSTSRTPLLRVVNDTRLRVALVGRPNVGKSTLYNKLIGRTQAITHNTPGVTRDCREGKGSLFNLSFTAIDTPGASNVDRLLEHTAEAISTADVAFLVTDAQVGLSPWDTAVATWLRKRNIPALHMLNKCDHLGAYHEDAVGIVDLEDDDDGHNNNNSKYAWYRSEPWSPLMLGRSVRVSGEHNLGLQDVYAALEPLCYGHEAQRRLRTLHTNTNEELDIGERRESTVRIALIGQANVGKSTMLNALLGKERVTVSPTPGTTRDAIEVRCAYGDRQIVMADTAGMRKLKWRSQDKIADLSHNDALRTMQFANVVVVLVDAMQGISRENLRIMELAEREGRGVVVAANKWDQIQDPYVVAENIENTIERSMSQLKGVPVVVCSALDGKNLNLLMEKALEVHNAWDRRIPTSTMNQFIGNLLSRVQLPAAVPKPSYITQVSARPPTFALFLNRSYDMPMHFQRLYVNAIREEFDLYGCPIRFHIRTKEKRKSSTR